MEHQCVRSLPAIISMHSTIMGIKLHLRSIENGFKAGPRIVERIREVSKLIQWSCFVDTYESNLC